jgi:anti-sigma factor RsiW
MAHTRKSLASKVAATVVIGGTLSLAGVAAALPASAATTSSPSHASVLTHISSTHPNKYPPCDVTINCY